MTQLTLTPRGKGSARPPPQDPGPTPSGPRPSSPAPSSQQAAPEVELRTPPGSGLGSGADASLGGAAPGRVQNGAAGGSSRSDGLELDGAETRAAEGRGDEEVSAVDGGGLAGEGQEEASEGWGGGVEYEREVEIDSDLDDLE